MFAEMPLLKRMKLVYVVYKYSSLVFLAFCLYFASELAYCYYFNQGNKKYLITIFCLTALITIGSDLFCQAVDKDIKKLELEPSKQPNGGDNNEN